MSNCLQLDHVDYAYGAAKSLGLSDGSADFESGKMYAITGPSGAGKSTRLRSLNLLEVPTAGEIDFDGVDITKKKVKNEAGKWVKLDLDKHRQKMGRVFQNFNLFPHMTILDNKTLAPIQVKPMPKAEAEQKFAEAEQQLDDAQKQLEAANEAVVDANLDIFKAKAELANDEALRADLEAVDHKASLAAGTTGNEKLVKLNAAYARYKAAVDAAAGLKAALSDADAKLSDANDAYAAALAELGDAKDALAAAQAEYDKYHPKAVPQAKPQAKPQVTQATAKASAAKKQTTSGALAQTGDDSALAGEVFVIGGITLVAAGVTLSDRRRKQM